MSTDFWSQMHDVLREVGVERFRQERLREEGKFEETCASPSMSAGMKLAVLGEEFGEVARAIVEGDHENLRTELIQTAAVAVAWAESLEGGES